MSEREVRVSTENGIARVTLSRASKRNALTFNMMSELHDAFSSLAVDQNVRLIVLSGEGQDFCAGADLGDIANRHEGDRQAHDKPGSKLETLVHPLIEVIEALPHPVLAAVRGNAIGIGAQLILLADLAVASQSLSLRFPQATLGHSLDHGESWLLPRCLPMKKAMELSLLGNCMTGEDAFNFGLVNRLIPDDLLETETEKIIAHVLAVAPGALLHNKALLKASRSLSLAESLTLERRYFGESIKTRDFREAMLALSERRAPNFTGE